MATTIIGTPYYMSPELFSNKPYNSKVKIISKFLKLSVKSSLDVKGVNNYRNSFVFEG